MFAFTAGRGRIMSILISVFMAKLLVIEAPFLGAALSEKLNVAQSLQQLVSFVALFLFLFLFLARYAFRNSVDAKHAASFIFVMIFSVLQVGLLINVILGFLPATATSSFSPLVRLIFIDPPASFIWLVLPVAFIVFLGKLLSDRTEK